MKINILDIIFNLFVIAAICLIACIAFFLLALLDIATGWCITKITHLSLFASSVIIALHIIAVALFLNGMAIKSLCEVTTLADNSDHGFIVHKKRRSRR